jgi:hypothetical protein
MAGRQNESDGTALAGGINAEEIELSALLKWSRSRQSQSEIRMVSHDIRTQKAHNPKTGVSDEALASHESSSSSLTQFAWSPAGTSMH